MSQKTFMLESNNSSGKLFTDRARKNSRIGSNFLEQKNAQWNTTLNQGGLQINPGDTINISSTQINLRGEPDQCLEFSGSTNSTFKEQILDNKVEAEFGFYITNRQQYNMNLPLISHQTMGNASWLFRNYTMPRVLDNGSLATVEDNWRAFHTSYPCAAIEGCAKRHSSTAFGSETTVQSPEGAKNGIIMAWWEVVNSNLDSQENVAGQQGLYLAGRNNTISVPIANGNFEIACPNETRMYVCKNDYMGTLNLSSDRFGPGAYDETLVVQDIGFEVPEGFITPSSLGSDLTTVFHERLGDADNWSTESVDTSVYVHDTPWKNLSLMPDQTERFLGYFSDWHNNRFNLPKPADPTASPPTAAIPRVKYKLQKIPVADVTDKSYITINTSTGALLEKIYQNPNQLGSEAEWKDFGANIPNNKHFYWDGNNDSGATSQGDGSWGENYQQEKGAELFYNNLLTGDIGRTQSIEVWNQIPQSTTNEHQLTTDTDDNYALNWVKALNGKSDSAAAIDGVDWTLKGSYAGDTVTWNAGQYYTPGTIDPLNRSGIFGRMITVMDNYSDVMTPYIDPKKKFSPGLWVINTVGETEMKRHEAQPLNLQCDSIRPGQDFQVVPLNILASPMNIATVKKALYRAREIMPNSKKTFNSEGTYDSWTDSYVTRLDLGVKDDSMCINANIPNGYNNPDLNAAMMSCPCPYVIAQGFNNGYIPKGADGSQSIPPDLYPRGFSSYQNVNISAASIPPTVVPDDTGRENNNMPRLVKDCRQDIQNKNGIYAKTFWNEDCDPRNGNISLPEGTQFSFRNRDGEMPDYTRWFKPGGFDDAPDHIKEKITWIDGNENGLDEGVGLCVVYFNQRTLATTPTLMETGTNPNRNLFYTDKIMPPLATERLPGISNNVIGAADNFQGLIPYLAIVTPKFTEENEYGGYTYGQRICPCPMIGEICGFSSAFSDGKYAKVVTTQRVNPRAYETINESITEQNSQFLPQAYLFDSQYYNIYDYYPYIHIGAIDPKIEFSDTSGRFEISKLHTPATSSNGAWQEPPSAGAGEQSSDEIIIMNGRRSFVSHASLNLTLKGFTVGRLYDTVTLLSTANLLIDTVARASGLLLEVSDNIPIIPWGEIRQDTNTKRTISSQSGIGLLNYAYFSENDDGNVVRGALTAFTPQIYNETMFSKMGFEIEQLLPFGGNQNNNFNRSNYNKYLGTDNPLSLKNNNMLYPFTTNGYSTAIQSFDTTTNSWVGYDTCYAVQPFSDDGAPIGKATPPKSNTYSFYTVASKTGTDPNPPPVRGRPDIFFQTSFGDNSSTNLKELPPNEAITMYSLGGNSFGNESVATVDSDALIATNLPSKFNYSYLVIYSDIVGQSSNFITGSNLMLPTPAIGYMTRNYSSADFMYSFDSDFNYIADRSFLLNNFNVEIRQPNGRLANIEDNSTIIFKIVKNIRPILPIPQPVMKDIKAQDKEEEKEMVETIKEFV